MVRRGSPVRVRKRALIEALQTQGFCFPVVVHFLQRARVWNRFWNSQMKEAAILLSNQASSRRLGRGSARPGTRTWITRWNIRKVTRYACSNAPAAGPDLRDIGVVCVSPSHVSIVATQIRTEGCEELRIAPSGCERSTGSQHRHDRKTADEKQEAHVRGPKESASGELLVSVSVDHRVLLHRQAAVRHHRRDFARP
jgi:hypothetical protein